jgi:hypothetical protein
MDSDEIYKIIGYVVAVIFFIYLISKALSLNVRVIEAFGGKKSDSGSKSGSASGSKSGSGRPTKCKPKEKPKQEIKKNQTNEEKKADEKKKKDEQAEKKAQQKDERKRVKQANEDMWDDICDLYDKTNEVIGDDPDKKTDVKDKIDAVIYAFKLNAINLCEDIAETNLDAMSSYVKNVTDSVNSINTLIECKQYLNDIFP